MGGRRLGTGSGSSLKRAKPVLRLAGRLVATALATLFVTLVVVQFIRVIEQNIAAQRQLAQLRDDVAQLQRRRDQQIRELTRLRDPDGAIPEIHDRLRLVRPNEEIIFVSPAPSASPAE